MLFNFAIHSLVLPNYPGIAKWRNETFNVYERSTLVPSPSPSLRPSVSEEIEGRHESETYTSSFYAASTRKRT